MYRRATERLRRPRARAQSGAALASVLIVFVALAGVVYASSIVSIGEMNSARRSIHDQRARALSEAGVERARNFLDFAVDRNRTVDPLLALSNLFPGGDANQLYIGEALVDGNATVGEYSVRLRLLEVQADQVTIAIDSSGYLPAAPLNLAPGTALQAWNSVTTTVRYELEPSDVFNYGYFVNNWGWFYGDTIRCNGNARSNGQFDSGGYQPTVNGQPLYDGLSWSGGAATLTGYRDDNEDGLEDGLDGGIWSGWDVVNTQNVRGVGGNAANQHDFQEYVEMPNLSNLSPYETKAVASGGNISIGGTAMSNAVYGDEGGESKNLYLHGTPADPIVLDGPIVVRGDVIISGTVTGQGAIYAGGNVYVPDSIVYADGPSTARPADNTQASTEAWLTANQNKDFLGLFANENIVVGDHTDSTWRNYVSGWMASSLNRSDEDAGSDGIPNTSVGKDGIPGTADDDVLEDDGVFSVETYTQADEDLGLLPAGYAVGDPIPGSGEDIDGDGQYDGTTTIEDDIDFADALDSGEWGGNMPFGLSDYGDVSTLYAAQLDGIFYTNHTFAWTVFGSSDATINGALVSRNESVVYGTPNLDVNYDCRLLGGKSGIAGGLLPSLIQAPEVLGWHESATDPNRYAVAP